MRRVCALAVLGFAAGAHAQWNWSNRTYQSQYVSFFSAQSQLILGSEDPRTGGGFSFAVGRNEPKLRIGNLPSELVLETYYLHTSSRGVNGDPPTTTLSWGLLASSRYRWKFRSDINLYADVGFGVQWTNRVTYDLPLAFNTSPSLALGFELPTSKGESFLLGARLLHVSNGGRQLPNPGQNFLQWFISFKVPL
jgi:hypothetical protein